MRRDDEGVLKGAVDVKQTLIHVPGHAAEQEINLSEAPAGLEQPVPTQLAVKYLWC